MAPSRLPLPRPRHDNTRKDRATHLYRHRPLASLPATFADNPLHLALPERKPGTASFHPTAMFCRRTSSLAPMPLMTVRIPALLAAMPSLLVAMTLSIQPAQATPASAPQAQALPPTAAASAGRVTARAQASKGEQQAVQWFNMLDVNGDGRISSAEAQVAYRLKPSLARDFANADLNKDGDLTEDEIRVMAERRRAERQARRQAEAAAKAAATSNPGSAGNATAP